MRFLLQRYILEEIVAPFVVGTMVVLVMLLGDHLYDSLDLLLNRGVDLRTVGRLLLFVMPEMAVIALPLATVIAVSLGINRLVHELEWSSLRLAGASLAMLTWPVLVFGVVAMIVSGIISEAVAPAAKQEYIRINTRLSLADPTVAIDAQQWFQSPSRDRWIFVNAIDERSGLMSNLIVFSELHSDYPTVLMARTAKLEDGTFVLRDVVRHLWRPDGTLQRESETTEVRIQFASLMPEVVGQMPTSGEMTSNQLRQLIETQHEQGQNRPSDIVELNRRYAAPVACLLLALLCVPLNILTAHRGRFFGLLIAVVLVIVYFLTLSLGTNLGLHGALQKIPALGPWLQNILFAGLAAVLFWKCRS